MVRVVASRKQKKLGNVYLRMGVLQSTHVCTLPHTEYTKTMWVSCHVLLDHFPGTSPRYASIATTKMVVLLGLEQPIIHMNESERL